MARTLAEQAKETLSKNRGDALKLARDKGLRETQKMLQRAALDLQRRLREAEGLAGPGAQSFTATQLRSALAQVTQVTRDLVPAIRNVTLAQGTEAAEAAAKHTIEYLAKADKAFRGVGVQPLALNTARMYDRATVGVQSSILNRLVSGKGTPATDVVGGKLVEHPAKAGILQRYGVETIKKFEEVLQRGMIAKKSFAEMRDEITAQSPFLQGAPAHWADRIVRTEVMGAYSRAQWEATREADNQLGDVCKILSATFDFRTASDSYAVHGEIRRPLEAFETWYGLMQHPPARPNDRETVVTHRISWAIPPYLAWRDTAAVVARWHHEGRKGPPPPRPQHTTVPLAQFGRPQKRRPAPPPVER